MKLTTISVAAAAIVVFAQSAQAREHYRHHRYHAAHFARHYSSPGRTVIMPRKTCLQTMREAICAEITRAKIIQIKVIRNQAPMAAKSVPISAGVRRRGAVGRCGSWCPAIRGLRSIWRATGRIGDRPDRPVSARSWSGRTTSARSSARRAASGSSNPATTATGFAPGRARSPAPSPFAGDDRIARTNVPMNARGPLGKPGGPYSSCTSCTATTPRRQ